MDLNNAEEDFADDFNRDDPEPKSDYSNAVRILTIIFVCFVYFVIFLKILFIA
jgi:hypothetical protein